MIEKNDKKIEVGTRKIRRGTTTTNKVKRIKNVPLYRTSGNVTLTQDGAIYRFPNPYGAKQVTFNGLAVRYTAQSKIDIRANIMGIAQLAPSYYFTPQTSTSVGLSGPKQKIIQHGHYFLVTSKSKSGSTTYPAPTADDGVTESRAQTNETVLTNIIWPGSQVVARMEVVDYGPDYFEVLVNLASNWEIYGNFLCT